MGPTPAGQDLIFPDFFMQLHYFNESPNYGDALNPWLWPRLLGDRLQECSSTLFLGIGTILKPGLPEAERYVVLGSGDGYEAFPKPDSRWTFYAVRGFRDRESNFRRTCREAFSPLENKLQIRTLIAHLTALRKTFQGNLGLGHLSTDTVLQNQMQRLNRSLARLCETEN